NSLAVSSTAGNIWFYSPTGIIAGPTARFNVGSLILTTNDIEFTPNDTMSGTPGSIYGPGGLVQFRGPAGSRGTIEIQNGAQLSAMGENAYIGLVAPLVVQRGLVQADGQIAYVAAEQLDMTINGGLFDFTVTVGTTDAQGIVHSGTTTGPASTGVSDTQVIAMVAMPKNDALTMMLSGSIGYEAEASGISDGSEVMLSACTPVATPLALPDNRLGSIEIGNAAFLNPVDANATDAIRVAPTGGAATFAGNATLYALDSVSVTAEAGEQ